MPSSPGVKIVPLHRPQRISFTSPATLCCNNLERRNDLSVGHSVPLPRERPWSPLSLLRRFHSRCYSPLDLSGSEAGSCKSAFLELWILAWSLTVQW